MQSEFKSQPKGSHSGFKTCIFTLRENINATHVVKLENWTLYLIIIWEALPWDIRRINSLNLNPLLIPVKYLSNVPKYSAPWKMFIPCYNIKGVEFLDSLEWNGSMSSSFFVANQSRPLHSVIRLVWITVKCFTFFSRVFCGCIS